MTGAVANELEKTVMNESGDSPLKDDTNNMTGPIANVLEKNSYE